jgi:beta-galactosidase
VARRSARASEFAIGDHDFLLDGEPFRVLSGALHYFRVDPGHWADRIRKARLMGLNTVETYVAWIAHELREGVFSLSGGLDLGQFLDLIAAEGMYAIVRPGPYICAELDNGGPIILVQVENEYGAYGSDQGYLQALAELTRQIGITVPLITVDQPDDTISMTERSGTGLVVNNASGLTQVRWGWGD